jgi:hypothetical protein
MILAMEVWLLGMGLWALVTGRLNLGKGRVLHGCAARLLGLVGVLAIPLAFCGALIVGVILVAKGWSLAEPEVPWIITGVEAVVVVTCLVVIYGVGGAIAGPSRLYAHPRELQIEAFRRNFPERFAAPSRPTVALATAALFRYGEPQPVCEEVPPEPQPARPGWPAWAILLLIAAVGGLVTAVVWACVDSSATANAEAEERNRVEPTQMPARPGEPPLKILPENERADGPDHVPAALHPQLRQPGGVVYLSDLQEFAWKPGASGWAFGKAGRLGAPGRSRGVILYDRTTAAKGLSMHPPHIGYTRVCYYLGRRAQSLRAAVCISNDDRRTPPNPTRFVILGDGKLLWRSPSIRHFGDMNRFTLDISQVNVLELRTYVESGNCTGSHAAWLDPYVMVKR